MSSGALPVRVLKRVSKELEKWRTSSPEERGGLTLTEKSPSEWHIGITGAVGTPYEGERFLLSVQFEEDYPMTSPITTFVVDSEYSSPEHVHCYSNGHICLNILGADWSPALTVQSICLSVLSMLSSAEAKGRPPGDARYSSSHPVGSNPKKTKWLFDDDGV
jgi:ubiquitin-conjugating enzyme E2 W